MARFATTVLIPESAVPATPPANSIILFAKSDGRLYYKDDKGAELGPLAGSAIPANMVTTDGFGQKVTGKRFTDTVYLGDHTAVPDNTPSPAMIFTATGEFITERSIQIQAFPGVSAPYLHVNGEFRADSVLDNGSRVYSVSNKVPVSGISATGTASSTTYLRGDGTWATVAGSSATNVVVSANTTAHKMTVAATASPPPTPAVGDVWVVSDLDGGAASAPANMLTTDTAQTITGVKTFTAAPALPTGTTLNGQSLYTNIEPYPLGFPDALTVQTGKSRIYLEHNYAIETIRASVNTAPAGASVIVDVNLNGTSIYTTQSNRPTIIAGANTALGGTPNTATIAAGQYLTVDIDQIGSTTAGSDLTVVIRLRRT